MAPSDDLATHATSSHDFYALLDLDTSATSDLTQKAISKAHRRAALKHHPDKNAGDPLAAQKFHLIQIAYEVLSDAGVRAAYDNAREARLARARQKQAYVGRRREMMEDLERREKAAGAGAGFKAAAGAKRGRGLDEEEDPEERLAREVRRLAEDGKRRRTEREGRLRQKEEDEQQARARVKERRENGSKSVGEVHTEGKGDDKSASAAPAVPSKTAAKKGVETGAAFEQSTLARLRAAAAAKKQQQQQQPDTESQNDTTEGQSSAAAAS